MIKQLLAVGVMGGLAGVAQAQEADVHQYPGPYLGGALMHNTLGLEVAGQGTVDTDDWGGQVIAGYRFSPWVAIEGSYANAGSYGFSDGRTGFTYDPRLLAISGVLSLPVADGLSVFGRLSAVRWDADVVLDDGRFIDYGTANGTDVGYGIGAQYASGPLATRISYDVVDMGDDGTNFKLKQLALAIIWKF